MIDYKAQKALFINLILSVAELAGIDPEKLAIHSTQLENTEYCKKYQEKFTEILDNKLKELRGN